MAEEQLQPPPVFRLPEWNDLTKVQRRDLVSEAEHWSGAYDCADLAAGMYAKIRDLVQVEPPPLMMRLHGSDPAPSTHGDGWATHSPKAVEMAAGWRIECVRCRQRAQASRSVSDAWENWGLGLRGKPCPAPIPPGGDHG